MSTDLSFLQQFADQAVAGILRALPTATGASREALLEALNALDDIEALAEIPDGLDLDLCGDEVDAPEVLTDIDIDAARADWGRPAVPGPVAALARSERRVVGIERLRPASRPRRVEPAPTLSLDPARRSLPPVRLHA